MIFTKAAAKRASEILTEDDINMHLRVFVSGGGCSGFQYGFKVDEKKDDDTIIETDGIELLIDPLSIQYLMNSEIDFVEEVQGSYFIIRNPDAKTTCGCGSSFGV